MVGHPLENCYLRAYNLVSEFGSRQSEKVGFLRL